MSSGNVEPRSNSVDAKFYCTELAVTASFVQSNSESTLSDKKIFPKGIILKQPNFGCHLRLDALLKLYKSLGKEKQPNSSFVFGLEISFVESVHSTSDSTSLQFDLDRHCMLSFI